MPQYPTHSWFKKATAWQEKSAMATQYSSLKSQEPSNDGDSASCIDESLDIETTTFISRQRRRWRGFHTALTAILVIVATVQAVLLLRPPLKSDWPVPDCQLQDSLQTFLLTLRAVKTHSTKFQREFEWEFSPKSLELWSNAIPGSGLVAIKNPERYGLQKGLETSAPNSMVYGVQVTHEYHCLVSYLLERIPDHD